MVYTSTGVPCRASTESFATPACAGALPPQAQRAVSLPDSFLLRVRAGKRQADIAYKNHGLMFSFGWRASDRPEPRLMDARLL